MKCPRCGCEFTLKSGDDNYLDGDCPQCDLHYYWEEEYDAESGEEYCYRIWGELGEPYKS